MHDSRPRRRVAIVAGLRTPFAKSGTVFRDVSAVALARHAARELLYRSELDGREVDEVIFGQVVPSVLTPNVAREVSLLPQLLPNIPAYTLNRACASSGQTITNAADQIALGHADTIIAGGVESLSDIPILHSRRFSQILVDAGKARTLGARLGTLAQDAAARPPPGDARRSPSRPPGKAWASRPRRWPRRTGSPGRRRTGWRCRATSAPRPRAADGRLAAEIAPWFGGREMQEIIGSDNGIRTDASLDALAKLKPVFDRRYGSVTAGNSSPLTDGASAVLLMSEEKALALGYAPLAYVQELCRERGGSGVAAPHGSRVRRAQGARARRHRLGRPWPRRDSRGVRRTGALERSGVGLA